MVRFMIKILFVCMGNICRSPTAEGVFKKLIHDEGLAGQFYVDSAGTHAYHIGEAPDKRAQKAAIKRGVVLSEQRGRQVETNDLINFDYVLAMDNDNLDNLLNICPAGFESRISLFLSHASELGINEVPDPYYGGKSGFDHVLDLTEQAAMGLLNRIRIEKNI